MAAKDSRSPQDRHFRRRLKATTEGLHLPTEIELLRGFPFLADDMTKDAREFSERLSRRLKHNPKFEIAPLVASLDDLAVDQSVEALRCVQAAMEDASGFSTLSAHDARLRIRYYLASCGDPDAAASIAGATALIALTDVKDYRDPQLVPRALAWAVVANNYGQLRRDGFVSVPLGRLNRDLRSYAEAFEAVIKPPGQESRQSDERISSSEKAEDDTAVAKEEAPQTKRSRGGIVIFNSIGNDSTSEGKRVAKEFEKVLDVALPLPPVPDLARVRQRLAEEFPYAVAVVDELLKSLIGREHVHLRPTILLGTPGCGKTRLARRLCEELAAPFELVSCGGLNDSAVGGTARRWSRRGSGTGRGNDRVFRKASTRTSEAPMKRRRKRNRHVRHQRAEEGGNSMNQRLASHLLTRLRRRAMALALEDALEAGILVQEDVESHGRVISVYRRNREPGAMSPTQVLATLSRHRRRLPSQTPYPLLGSQPEYAFDEEVEPGELPTGRHTDAKLRDAGRPAREISNDVAMVRAMRAAAEPPPASEVAAMLLVAQAVADNETTLRDVLGTIRLRRPIVTVCCETKGFERTFLDLLKKGLILPGAVERSNGYEWVSGWQREREGQMQMIHRGHLGLFSNFDQYGNPLPRMNTLLIDSEQIESGEALDANFREMAKGEIEQFRREKQEREGAAAGAISDSELLREVMNTVGQKGRLGEQIRCVVSVSMLTEGWDANTVTHILGVRAFGTQLLCEQVIGRGLRRQSYELNPETGLFETEYADILGIPFDFATEPQKVTKKPPKPVTRVSAVRERERLAIGFPRVAGYPHAGGRLSTEEVLKRAGLNRALLQKPRHKTLKDEVNKWLKEIKKKQLKGKKVVRKAVTERADNAEDDLALIRQRWTEAELEFIEQANEIVRLTRKCAELEEEIEILKIEASRKKVAQLDPNDVAELVRDILSNAKPTPDHH